MEAVIDELIVSEEHVVFKLDPEADLCLGGLLLEAAVVTEVEDTPDLSMVVISSDKYEENKAEDRNEARYFCCNPVSTVLIASSKQFALT